MPHLVQLDKRYKKKGLSLITVECQNSPKEAIDGVLKKARADFPVTKGTTRPPTMQGIPHAAVFDASGKLVFAGHPSDDDFERSIKKALRGVDADSGSSSDANDSPFTDNKPVIESRIWTNAEGRKITASVVSIDGDKVKFKLSNGKEVPYAIAKLSEEDQELIKKSSETKETDE